MYLLRSGRIQLSRGRRAIVDHLTAGHFFGEQFLLGRAREDREAKALSPVDVDAFRRSELLNRLQDRRFCLRLLKSLALRLDRYEQTFCSFVTERAERRLARLLCRLAPVGPGAGWVQLPSGLTNPSLAKMVGTTRWRISHFLNHFRELGWLRREHGLWVQREGIRAFLQSQ
jgi:CRP-like cAMP-binding protein